MSSKFDLQKRVLAALSALAHTTRIEAFRLLSEAGSEGMGAGLLAKQLGCPHNTLSTHLAKLQTAGLIQSERDGRNVNYYLVSGSLGQTVSYLLSDCRGAIPEASLIEHLQVDLQPSKTKVN